MGTWKVDTVYLYAIKFGFVFQISVIGTIWIKRFNYFIWMIKIVPKYKTALYWKILKGFFYCMWSLLGNFRFLQESWRFCANEVKIRFRMREHKRKRKYSEVLLIFVKIKTLESYCEPNNQEDEPLIKLWMPEMPQMRITLSSLIMYRNKSNRIDVLRTECIFSLC